MHLLKEVKRRRNLKIRFVKRKSGVIKEKQTNKFKEKEKGV